MSILHMSKVWNESDLEPTQKLVFLAICDNANDEGLCYPSIDTIQNKTSLSRPTVIKIISKLEELGKIIKVQRAKKNGGRYSSLYLVFPDENYEFLDDEFKEKFSQSKMVLPYSQSKVALLQNDSQSKVALPKPLLTLYNHQLFKELSTKERDLYLEYISLRKKLKLTTTMNIHNRLLEKYFELGRNIEVIEKAINSNWRDFYQINNKQPKQQKKRFEDMTLEEKFEFNEKEKQRKLESNYGYIG